MADNKIVGYKNIFGFVLPDWVDEATIRLTVTFLLSASVMLFVLIFVIWPKFETIKQMKITLKNGNESLTFLKSSKVGFDKLNEQVPEASQNLILSAIPQTYSPETAIFLLRKIASETPGLSIISYKLPAGVLFGSDTAKEGGASKGNQSMVNFLSYPIRLTVTAPVESLLLFVSKIETSLPYGVVSDLGMQEVTKLASSATTKAVQMELEIKYYQSVLQKVDISKIKPVTDSDLAEVKSLSTFTTVGVVGLSQENATETTTGGSGNLFGF